MRRSKPLDSAASAMGLPKDLLADAINYQDVLVFPDNWRWAMLFQNDLMTQWRFGMNGPTGLDYSALLPVFTIRGVSEDDRQDALDAIQTMERSALREMNSK